MTTSDEDQGGVVPELLQMPTELRPNVRRVRSWDRERRPCEHRHTVVDEAARTLFCEDCGVALDPIRHIVTMALWDERVDRRLAELRKWMRDATYHAPGSDGALTRCGIRPGGRALTVTVTTQRHLVSCGGCLGRGVAVR